MNNLQPGSFKWEMSKKMPKTLLGLVEETQKYTIAKALYFTGHTCFTKE